MRMSCNGCRVLRKGCSEDCSIRPCLDWIKNPDAQANATVFLAKFYGRAGLMNLINAGPQHLRPAIFRSLLYEACGRILNPIFGSVGLLWSGSWQLCQDAVEAVLNGSPITRIESETAAQCPPLKAYDIRHVSKGEETESTKTGSNGLKRVRTRGRFKRSKVRSTSNRPGLHHVVDEHHLKAVLGCRELEEGEVSPSHGSSLSHQSEPRNPSSSVGDLDQGLDHPNRTEDGEVELELTLGFEPLKRCSKPVCGGK